MSLFNGAPFGIFVNMRIDTNPSPHTKENSSDINEEESKCMKIDGELPGENSHNGANEPEHS
jgi:hypothetical protein